MTQLKSNYSDGQILSTGTISDTSGLNAITNRINTHNHYGGDTPTLYSTLIKHQMVTTNSINANNVVGSAYFASGTFNSGDYLLYEIAGVLDNTGGSIFLAAQISGVAIGNGTSSTTTVAGPYAYQQEYKFVGVTNPAGEFINGSMYYRQVPTSNSVAIEPIGVQYSGCNNTDWCAFAQLWTTTGRYTSAYIKFVQIHSSGIQ
jgi:hypothetical protein